MNKIEEFYESKKNLSKMMSWTIIIKFFDMMKLATRHKYTNVTKTTNEYFERQITKLKEMIKKLKRMTKKTKNTIEENIWTKIMIRQSTIAILIFFLREINAFSKWKSSKKIKLMTWIKEKQKMKRVQKINAAKMIILTHKSNIENTLTACKNIVKIKKFKELIIFKVIFERRKKILKFNDFWIKDVVSTIILRREKFKIIIHEIKVKSMPQDIKNKKAKMMKKIDEIMHSRL